jgi:hypothetical protein
MYFHVPTENKIDDVKNNFYKERVFDKFPKYHTKILFGDSDAKVGRGDIFKPKIGNESSHEISNDNGVRIVNFATPKDLTVKSIILSYPNIHKFTRTSHDGKIQNKLTIFE